MIFNVKNFHDTKLAPFNLHFIPASVRTELIKKVQIENFFMRCIEFNNLWFIIYLEGLKCLSEYLIKFLLLKFWKNFIVFNVSWNHNIMKLLFDFLTSCICLNLTRMYMTFDIIILRDFFTSNIIQNLCYNVLILIKQL